MHAAEAPPGRETTPASVRSSTPGEPADALAPARGVIVGVLAGLAGWAGILWVAHQLLRRLW